MTRMTRLMLILYPFGAGAMGINLFFASLIGTWIGWPAMPPVWSVIGGAILGLPATWVFSRHISNLMDRADAES
ncbi:hypothetical protein [Jannaschia rubra]|uniref:NnrT protein n=1 Tax=Jannaschia rubra TaxID=282197 RepID=A0A0M6XPY2_9RHOB|nr:hypothetical protein [Jannaschia rubra]CTQ32732.1 hypothetical protein JAN5088_01504 [Jannaschia rubra]SFF88450.1 hypothetical protein SAMN04488517_101667 [Jannaschia rubra]